MVFAGFQTKVRIMTYSQGGGKRLRGDRWRGGEEDKVRIKLQSDKGGLYRTTAQVSPTHKTIQILFF